MNGNIMILQLLLFLCSATPTLLASAGSGESDSQVDTAAASSKLAPRASTTILPFEDNLSFESFDGIQEQHPEVKDGRTAVIDASTSGYSLDDDNDTNYKDGTTATAAARENTNAKTRESDSLQAADSSELAPMQSTAAKKIVTTMEDDITSPSSSSSSSSPTSSILSKIHPLLLIKAIDAIRRDRVESWTRSSNRRLKEWWDVFTWTSKSGKGKGGKSDEEEEEEEEEDEDDARFLYVQMADQCTFEQWSDGTYRFYSSLFLSETFEFTDMPLTEERQLFTGEFFSDFHSVYFRENDHPNTAFTLVDKDNSDGVVVSALASAFVEYPNGEEGTPLYGYVLDQSKSQASVRSLSDVLDGGSEKTYDHCSIFVDDGAHYNPYIKLTFPKGTRLYVEEKDKSDYHDDVSCKAYHGLSTSSIDFAAPDGIHHDWTGDSDNWVRCKFRVEFPFPAFPEPSSCSCDIKMIRYRYSGLGGRDRYGLEENGCDCFGINRVSKLSDFGLTFSEQLPLEWPCPRIPDPKSSSCSSSNPPRYHIEFTPVEV